MAESCPGRLRRTSIYSLRVGSETRLETAELDDPQGGFVEQLELVVPFPLDSGGEIVAVEIELPLGFKRRGWSGVEDFSVSGGEIRIPVATRAVRPEDSPGASLAEEIDPRELPSAVRVFVAKP